ncbi:hypothetical protein ROLI_012290 [Roseobacter fucihabitans]|uniref:Uncharacterized protein n=1 Tax=Roseobacter fucihabitans TaxID=1537242 RepID=A0ABZ2BQ99_9RHOB|nr:hypothetical protein [Roseobacter litoralis]MBC6964243.1 hypothetical protein [Roseobacter litoralis]
MTLDEAIKLAEQTLILAALLGVVWSAVGFIKGQKEETERRQSDQLSKWRKIAVHQLVANSEPYLSVAEVMNKLRARSFETSLNIRKEDLSEDSVRQLMMEMVQAGILGQVYPDRFGIVQLPLDITVGAVADNIHARYAAKNAFREIFKHPKRFSSEELYSELKPTPPMDLSDFVLSLLNLENHGAAKRGPDGKWFPVTHKEQA